MTNTNETTDINIRESAQRVVALLEQNRAREALALLERERTGERLAVQEALDRYVAADGSRALATLRANGVPGELAPVVDRLERASGAPRYPVVESQPRGTDELRGLTEAQRYDVYASILQTQGNQAARTALTDGDRVILGLRQENATLAAASRAAPGQPLTDNPNTPRDESRGGTGVYDDRLVVLWRDANGNGHAYEALLANTEPTAQYDHHAGSDGRRPYSDGGSDRQVRAASAGYGDILHPRKIEGDDVNNDRLRDLGRLAEGTYEMQRTTHPWGGQQTFALRPTEAAVRNGQTQVERDTNADGYFTAADINGRQPLNSSFKIHFGSMGNTDSAGCQTIHPNYTRDFASAVQGNPQQSRWQYVLVSTASRQQELRHEVGPAHDAQPARPAQGAPHAPAPHAPARPPAANDHGAPPQRAPGRGHAQAFPAEHRSAPLFEAIRRQMPEGTSIEQTAFLTLKARESGIREPDQVGRVVVQQNQAWVAGITPGFLAKADLSVPAPPLAETLRQVERLDQQQAAQGVERPQMASQGMGARGMA